MGADASVCPLCGERNACGIAAGKTTCWCFEVAITEDALARIPDEARNVACVCARCASGPIAPGPSGPETAGSSGR